ncbi:Predicted metal-dependent hydrolase, TIM-barrel fold [Variovorax sp. HW608]|uniref:amidohydrolase family protein n=1 Tax=Variovorax sp. HW608 TaxID=1034889 RepID=UPI00081FD838|nr:amidohydrolase family protein [Variovorax sp. HW608]SCK21082.1 Predicted metal-dependent hydrolase, TIM-barrel fold [Variovorax sp. HW608]
MNAQRDIFEQPKIDCHCHVLDPDRFPYAADAAYHPSGAEIGTLRSFQEVLAVHGVRHALLVQPNSGYNADNRCMLDAIRQGEGRFKGVAIVPPDISMAQLQDLKAQGIVGVAHNFALLGEPHEGVLDALWDRLAQLDMFVQVQVRDDQMVRLGARLRGCGARILVDHHGRPDLRAGVGGAGFQALLALAESSRCYVKLSGYDKFSLLPFPFDDAMPFSQALLAQFGAEHCLWASDWPHLRAVRRLDYGPLLALFMKLVPDEAARASILYHTPRRLFGFDGG